MKFLLTIITLFLLSGLSFSNDYPVISEWFSGQDNEGIDVPEPGGNWRVIHSKPLPPPPPPFPPDYYFFAGGGFGVNVLT